jgi:thiol-disulfide isomerase/thioredoxin
VIIINTTGITGDLMLTRFYIGLIKAHQIELFENIYNSSFTNNIYFLNAINKEYYNLKVYLSNQDTHGANIQMLSTDITKNLIDSITEKYLNKVIYVDFWAPWCGPCLKEMPLSKEIQSYYNDKEVVFLFLGVKCTENSWRASIANQGLTGEHILLTDDQYNVLASKLGISGIPHYTLIDKNGNIKMKYAPRPSEKDRLIIEIDELLSH